MAFPTYTLSDLSSFSGRDVTTYTRVAYAAQALRMSMLLFKRATCLEDWPTDTEDAELATYAVLALADDIYIDQDYAEARRSPFQSETIGSYSYSRANKAIESSLPTGVTWFDLAVSSLGICESGDTVASGSIQVFSDDLILVEDTLNDIVTAIGPEDVDGTAQYVSEGSGLIYATPEES